MCHDSGLHELLGGAHGQLTAAIAAKCIHFTRLREEPCLLMGAAATVLLTEVEGTVSTDLGKLWYII